MRQLFFIIFILCWGAAVSQAALLFSSDFEVGELFTSDSVFKNQYEIPLYAGNGWYYWPLERGKGVICAENGSIISAFEYKSKQKDKFVGVSGFSQNFAPFSLVKMGGLAEWDERSAIIQVVQSRTMEGCYFARMSNPHAGYIALTQSLDSLSTVNVEFKIAFSDQYLKQPEKDFFHSLMGEASASKFVHAGLSDGKPAALRFVVWFGNEKSEVILHEEVNPGQVYRIAYGLDLSQKKGVFGVRVHGDSFKEVKGRTVETEEKICRIRFYNRLAARYDIDEIRVYDDLESIGLDTPSAPVSENSKVLIEAPSDFTGKIQYMIYRKGRSYLPLYLSRPLSDKRLEIPVNSLVSGQGRVQVAWRLIDAQYNSSPWSDPVSVNLEMQKSGKTKRLVQSLMIYPVNAKKPISHLVPGRWYDLKLKVHPSAWKTMVNIRLYHLSPDPKTQWVYGPVYEPMKSFFIDLSLRTRGVWTAMIPHKRQNSEVTGKMAPFIDGTSQGFILDPSQNTASIRFRLPENVEHGPWVLRTDPVPGFHEQQVRLVTVGPLAANGSSPIRGILLFITAVGVILVYWTVRQSRSKSAQKVSSLHLRMVSKVKETIENKYNTRINFNELAKSNGYTEGNLRKIFIKQFKVTPKQYLTNIRLDKSKDLLVKLPDSVNEIAFSLGFEDPSTFIHAFKKRFGITPTRWRDKKKGIF
jgi:AraC-like DNA-binding protein